MKGKFLPVGKMSKKARRAHFSARRGSWGEISPVTRRTRNAKAYDRQKARREAERFDAGPF